MVLLLFCKYLYTRNIKTVLVKLLFDDGRTSLKDKYNNSKNVYTVHMKFMRDGCIHDDGGHSSGLPLLWVGPAAFQFRVSLTIELRVAVDHRRDSDQHLPFVSLHHQLQLPTRLLDQLPCVAE